MGLLDGLIGGVVGAELQSLATHVIEKHGGVQGIVAQFEQQGLGPTVQSWIGNGPNAAISGDQLHQVLGPEVLQGLASKLGISSQELASKLSAVLPQVVDKMTPQGTVPAA